MMWITFRLFFRRIDVVGLDKLIKGKPVILIANHPASFMDAMVLAIFLKRSIHFYVRGDIFSHPVAYRLLTMLHMIPIYSREHGMKNVGKNGKTFDRGRQLLLNKKALLVFPEGFSRLSKKLEPFRKGTARVALQTAADPEMNEELMVQAVAINYSWHGLGADLYIRVGDTLSTKPFLEEYARQPAVAVNKLTLALQEMFAFNVIHIPMEERSIHVEDVIRMLYRSNTFDPARFFERAAHITRVVSQMSEEEFNVHVGLMHNYNGILKRNGLSDRRLSGTRSSIGNLLLLVVLFPFYLFGALFWIIPAMVAKWIANKTVTRIDFYTSVMAATMGLLGFLWWLVALLLALTYGTTVLKLMVLFSPVVCFIALRWWTLWKYEKAHVKYLEKLELNPLLIWELEMMRKRLLV